MKTLPVMGLGMLLALPFWITVEARPHEIVTQQNEQGTGGERDRERSREGSRQNQQDERTRARGDRDNDRHHERSRSAHRADNHRHVIPHYAPRYAPPRYVPRYVPPRYVAPRYDYHSHWNRPVHHRPGYRVRALPVGYKTVLAAGLTFFVLNEIWYQRHEREYVVVERPSVEYRVIHEPVVVGDNGMYSIDVRGTRYYIKEGRYYRRNSDGEYLEVAPPN